MRRLMVRLSCVGFCLLLGFITCPAQTVSRCTPSRPMRADQRHGIIGLSFTRDGRTLVSAGADGNIKFWNVATGQVSRTLAGHTNSIYKAVFSPNEKLLASSSRDTTTRIWDVATGRELHKLTGFRCSVKEVRFSPDGRLVASVGNDGMLKLWDVKSGQELKSLVHSTSPDVDTSIYSIAFSRDGKRIYAGNGDKTISEWDVATGKETKVWKAHDDVVLTLTFSPDHRVLASGGFGDLTVKLWDTATWREIRTLAEKKTAGFTEALKPIAFSPNGKLIAASTVGFDPKLRQYAYIRTLVWNVGTGEKLFTLGGHKLDVDALAFTPDGRFLVTGGTDTVIKFWDIKTGQETRTFTVPPAVNQNN
jgi:WD40 repeat protein